MSDYIVRATAAEETVRAFAIRSTELTAEAREIHHTFPVVTAALGRLLSAGAMMGSMMKGEKDKLTLQMKGDGPIAQMTVTADSHGNVKGFAANPSVNIPLKRAGKLDVGGAVGKGFLTVIMDLGLKEPYNGQVEIQTGEIGDDLAYYYIASQVQANSPMSLVTTYTNIEGGYGLFSSRTKIERVANLSANTKRELFGISPWGFKEQ